MTFSNLDLTDKRILIIEDDLPSVKYYETLLRNSNCELTILQTGKDFVDYIKQEDCRVDIVIMDFLIPLINGIDCIRIFRKENRNVPVLMITAYSSEHAKTEAYLAGCTEYVLKPVYPEKIFFLIHKYLNQEIHVESY